MNQERSRDRNAAQLTSYDVIYSVVKALARCLEGDTHTGHYVTLTSHFEIQDG